jgi:hypothetical protein
MDNESRADAGTRPADAGGRDRDTIVIQIPAIDPELRQLLCDFFPGRAVLRLLSNPPKEAIEHARNARRERLLAMRSFIDALIEDTDHPRAPRRAREVRID